MAKPPRHRVEVASGCYYINNCNLRLSDYWERPASLIPKWKHHLIIAFTELVVPSV